MFDPILLRHSVSSIFGEAKANEWDIWTREKAAAWSDPSKANALTPPSLAQSTFNASAAWYRRLQCDCYLSGVGRRTSHVLASPRPTPSAALLANISSLPLSLNEPLRWRISDGETDAFKIFVSLRRRDHWHSSGGSVSWRHRAGTYNNMLSVRGISDIHQRSNLGLKETCRFFEQSLERSFERLDLGTLFLSNSISRSSLLTIFLPLPLHID